MAPRTPGAALPEHPTWPWRSPEPRSSYDVVVKGGRDRIGETIYSPVDDHLAAVIVTEPVFYDKQGARRDG